MTIEHIKCDKCKETRKAGVPWAKIKGIEGKRLHLCYHCYKEFLTWIDEKDVLADFRFHDFVKCPRCTMMVPVTVNLDKKVIE